MSQNWLNTGKTPSTRGSQQDRIPCIHEVAAGEEATVGTSAPMLATD